LSEISASDQAFVIWTGWYTAGAQKKAHHIYHMKGETLGFQCLRSKKMPEAADIEASVRIRTQQSIIVTKLGYLSRRKRITDSDALKISVTENGEVPPYHLMKLLIETITMKVIRNL